MPIPFEARCRSTDGRAGLNSVITTKPVKLEDGKSIDAPFNSKGTHVETHEDGTRVLKLAE